MYGLLKRLLPELLIAWAYGPMCHHRFDVGNGIVLKARVKRRSGHDPYLLATDVRRALGVTWLDCDPAYRRRLGPLFAEYVEAPGVNQAAWNSTFSGDC